jgi:hypothetical protein
VRNKTCGAGAVLLLLCAAMPALAQGGNEEELRKKRAAKVAEPWFTMNPWTDDYDVARQRAKESGKVIFGYFTRSYAG